jgi:DNA-directed RNA polymerase subunit alpha
MEQTILLPTTIEFLESDSPDSGKIVVTPCHKGYGTTIGNALRRVLLSSLPGAAVETVKIKGVQHEFSTIDGVQEDVVEILLNLKQIAVKSFSEEVVTLSLEKKGEGPVTAKDFEKNADIEIVNQDLVIANITDKSKVLEMEITIGKGRGYVPASEKDTKSYDLGTIAVDSLYTPIRDVGYNVELTRVGDVTDYEKLTLRVDTNGTITPKEAVSQATKILMNHFSLILDLAGDAKQEE